MTGAFVDELATEESNIFTASELAAFRTSFASARGTLINTLTSLDSAIETLRKAKLAGSGGSLSAADASVKQALGALRAAEANYAKTIIRTPIAGTVNTLSVKSGDYLSVGERVAIVANNNTLLIRAYVSEPDRARLAIGETVTIDGNESGTIANIAPAIDPDTKKIEVLIRAKDGDALAHGDTVALTFSKTDATDEVRDEAAEILIPITALKAEADRLVVFTVDAESRLVAHEVTVGQLAGAQVVIESGITAADEIVLDARGLNEGDEVETSRR